jgi:ABC-type hemin transport system substrate-binding protein
MLKSRREVLRALSLGALCAALSCGKPEPAGIVVRDDLARDVALPRRIERVVTLAPNLTEIVFAIGAEKRLVATDSFSDTPEAARKLPRVGGLNPSVERIVAARPDIVIATTSGNPPSLASSLEAAHIPLFVLRTDRIEDIPRSMETLGRLLSADGASSAAEKVRAAIEAERRTRQKKPRVLFAVWADPLYAGGRDTFADDLLQLVGAENAVPVTGWPQLALESVAANPPDVVIYPDKSVAPAQVRALVDRVPSLRSVKIVAVDENVFTRPGPRVSLAARELNALLDRWERGGP